MEQFFSTYLLRHVVVVLLCLAGIIAGMAVDLYFGIRKAKINGEVTTSTGLKKTCEKAQKYLLPFFILVWIDILGAVILKVPIFSMCWSAYCIYCEWRSVLEKSWTKAELRKAEKTMHVVIENKADIAALIQELIQETVKANPAASAQTSLTGKSRKKKTSKQQSDDSSESDDAAGTAQ